MTAKEKKEKEEKEKLEFEQWKKFQEQQKAQKEEPESKGIDFKAALERKNQQVEPEQESEEVYDEDGNFDVETDFVYDPQAEKSAAQNVFAFGDGVTFFNPSKFTVGTPYWFRLLPVNRETREVFGNVRKLHVLKYMMPHYEKKDDGSPKWFNHIAEKCVDPQQPNSFLDFLKETLEGTAPNFAEAAEGYLTEEGGDIVNIFRHICGKYGGRPSEKFFNKFCQQTKAHKDTAIRIVSEFGMKEAWFAVVPIEKDLIEVNGKKYSKPKAKKGGILVMPWSIECKIFGDPSKNIPGIFDDYTDMSEPYKPSTGFDFCIQNTDQPGANKYAFKTRPVRQTPVWQPEAWKAENLPDLIGVAKAGCNPEKAIEIMKVHFGMTPMPDGEDTEVVVEDKAVGNKDTKIQSRVLDMD